MSPSPDYTMFFLLRTLMESQHDGPTPSAFNSPGGIRDDSILELAPLRPALNELPSPSSGEHFKSVHYL